MQPGAPGQPSRVIDAVTASRIADTSFSAYDVRFLQDMIPHHAQATVMTAMVPGRTNRPEILQVAKRIDATKSFYAQLTPEQQKTFDAQGGGFRHAGMKGEHRMSGHGSHGGKGHHGMGGGMGCEGGPMNGPGPRS